MIKQNKSDNNGYDRTKILRIKASNSWMVQFAFHYFL